MDKTTAPIKSHLTRIKKRIETEKLKWKIQIFCQSSKLPCPKWTERASHTTKPFDKLSINQAGHPEKKSGQAVLGGFPKKTGQAPRDGLSWM